ncbi:hypothetical protein Pmani_007372 [Petrolisthes manimaculis]|uniref:Scavenger receptor class B member 1 n=1 Tax=Petrolisthes manimaculis TaxID=1843537 RepID=A0AAE1QB13_9EUCA|nr:hypothetical protein Pmani_007372 [Petrolisthes manimaculis]
MDADNLISPQGVEGAGEMEPAITTPRDDETDSDAGSTTELFKTSRASRLHGISCCQIFSLLIAFLMLVLSIAMMSGCYQLTIYAFLKPQLVISEGSNAYKLWKETPVPMLLKFHVFNVTNPEEVKDGWNPIVTELGPYVWREYHKKENITFHPNETVTYYQRRWWVWDQEESGTNSPNDTIVILNVIPVTVAWMTRNHIYAFIIDALFNKLDEKLFINTTVGKILFDGVEDPVLDWLQKEVFPVNDSTNILGSGGIAEFDKFAWFYKRNMSLEYDGLFNMKTGTNNLSDLGLIDWWNKEHGTSFYQPPCNQIVGSAGEIFPPNQQKDKLVFFSSDLCMSATLFYKEETQFANVSGKRYWGTNHTFANSSMVPGNECYCVNDVCAPTGLLNAESCRMGAPAFLSFPHFLHADPFLLDSVDGLSPNETEHAFNIDIIPELGVPMNVNARLQINLRLLPLKNFRLLRNVPDMYFPTLWFEIKAQMTPELAHHAGTATFILRSPFTNVAIWCFLLILAIIIVAVVVIRMRRGYNAVAQGD